MKKNNNWPKLLVLSAAVSMATMSWHVQADQYSDAAKKWVSQEFDKSTLTEAEQLDELKWFAEAAKPFRGMTINVASETITTHEYESKVLAKAFEELTGIKVVHDLIQEGDVVEKLQTQISHFLVGFFFSGFCLPYEFCYTHRHHSNSFRNFRVFSIQSQ